MSSHREIEEVVRREKALSFTSLKKETGFCNGVLQYHIDRSRNIKKENGAIIQKEFCQSCIFKDFCVNSCLIKMLKKPRNRKIIEMLQEEESLTAISEKLDIDPSTAHYHLQKLESKGILENREPRPEVTEFFSI